MSRTFTTKQKEEHSELMKELYGKYPRVGSAAPHIGDAASYTAKHAFIQRHLGKAVHCILNSEHKYCRYEWANLDHKYSRNSDDYIQLCAKCHKQYDMGLIKIIGLTIVDRGGAIIAQGNKSSNPVKLMR